MKWLTVSLLLSFSMYVHCCEHFTKDRNPQMYKVVCFVDPISGLTRNGLTIDKVDPCMCTHLVYKFAILHNGYLLRPMNPEVELNTENNGYNGLYRQFNLLKTINPSLTTMIAVGGGDQNFINYVNLMQNAELRFLFAHNVVSFLMEMGFDGLDIGWSYPSSIQDPRTIYQSFVLLLQELRHHFEPHGFLLSASISGFQQQIDRFYDVAGISDNVDFINVASFTQTHGPIYEATPLFTKIPQMQPYSISYIVEYLLTKEVDPRKLVIGLPAYGLYRQEKTISLLNYNQLCFTAKQAHVAFDPFSKTASFVHNGLVMFDNPTSFYAKINFVRDQRLGGVMIFSLEMDDYSGQCGDGMFPLTSVASNMNLRPICPHRPQKPVIHTPVIPKVAQTLKNSIKGKNGQVHWMTVVTKNSNGVVTKQTTTNNNGVVNTQTEQMEVKN